VVLSLGAEEDASFASVATAQLQSTAHALATIAAVELLCSSRALRLQRRRPEEFGSPRLRAMMSAGFTLPANAEDRDLRADLDQAHQLIRASY